jgi:multidrug efflux system membrane fusion protein
VHKVLDRQSDGSGADVVMRRPPAETPSRTRRRVWPALVVVLGVLLAGAAWWLETRTQTPEPGRSAAERPTVVRLGDVTSGDMPVTLEGLGTVTSLSTVTVRTQIAGRILEVGFVEGQEIKKGDFLAQIDPQPFQAALDQAKGQLARDEAMLADARLDLARFEKLITQDSIARQQVDTQRALVQQDEAIIRADQANVESAQINLNWCRIVSLSDGRIGLRLVDAGNYVSPGDASGIAVVAQMKPITVIFTLPQDDIPQFIKKLRAGEPLPVQAYDRSGSTLLATGKLEAIDSQIDTTTGTVRLRATFPNEDEELFPNQFVNARLVVDTLHGSTLAPTAGVQIGAPGPYVYIANPDGTVSVRTVDLGPSNAQEVVIRKGLKPGDKIVVDGLDHLRDGAKIRTAEASPPTTSNAPTTPAPTAKDAAGAAKDAKPAPGAPAKPPPSGGK